LTTDTQQTFDLGTSWNTVLKEELDKPYMRELGTFVEQEEEHGDVFPPPELRFSTFKKTPYDQVKVVIVGQDPYHGPGQAEGMSFSVPPGVRPPPSLLNIFKEIGEDLGPFSTTHGSLKAWAESGVFLLNAILTVRRSQPASHKGRGWEQFTDQVLAKLNERETPLVFLLWGKYAQEKGHFLNRDRHLVLTSAHPSPFSATRFFGCRHFSKANQFLESKGIEPINWRKL